MLGDTAVAVHPDNEKLKHLIGKNAILPLVGRRIPIVGDDYADPEKGTGAVKITPAHDFNDFEVGKRHDLPQVNVLDVEGKLALERQRGVPRRRADVGRRSTRRMTLHGVDRFEARKTIVERLEDAGLIDKIEPHTHMVPHGDRSNVVIEPFLTDQWYVNAKALAVDAIAAVREGKTKFVPKNWEKTYFDWMENIQPWCISRQLWWGHQIPAWYGPDGKVFVAETEDEAVSRALAYYAETGAISDDQARNMATHPGQARAVPDPRRGRARHLVLLRAVAVLDARLAGRDAGAQALLSDRVLVTGFDIIFFWVARMMMMGLHFMKEVPFQRRLHPPSRPRREGRQDVEVEGQRRRSARHHRRLRRRRAALHAGARRGAGPRHQAVAAARREQPQLRDQAVERRALRRVQRRRPGRGLRSEVRQGDAQPLDRARDREGHARGDRGDRRLSLQRGGGRGLSLRLERLLRLVCRAGEAAADRAGRRGQGRDARHGGLGARRNPEAAAPVHAVHHRGAVARHRRDRRPSATRCWCWRRGRSTTDSTTPRPKPRSAG